VARVVVVHGINNLAATVFGIAQAAPTQLVIATELGIVSIRLPVS